jgi:asparagine synthase (glutamine-hydrolysing)
MFRQIRQLSPGHNLVVTANGSEERRYWDYGERTRESRAGQHDVEFREVLLDAVKVRLRADVPAAILLSGGLDSSAIASLAARSAAAPLELFSAAFPGFDRDEGHHARLVAERLGLSHSVVEYDPATLPADLDAATRHMDAPAGTGQILARWRLLEAVSRHARVVLEGQGADELLGGYPDRYAWPYVRGEIARLRPWTAPRVLLGLARTAAAFGTATSLGPALRGNRKRRHQPPGLQIIAPALAAATGPGGPGGAPYDGALDRALWRDHSHAVLPFLLHFGDAISMAHSVESRVPFLDHRLVEFVFALPPGDKIQGGTTKAVLRRALAGDVPPEIRARRDKVGFSTPIAEWIRPHVGGAIRPTLLSARNRQRELFSEGPLTKLLEAVESGERRGAGLLFRAYALARWYDLSVDGEGRSPASERSGHAASDC